MKPLGHLDYIKIQIQLFSKCSWTRRETKLTIHIALFALALWLSSMNVAFMTVSVHPLVLYLTMGKDQEREKRAGTRESNENKTRRDWDRHNNVKEGERGSRLAELFIWALTWTTAVYLLFRLPRMTMTTLRLLLLLPKIPHCCQQDRAGPDGKLLHGPYGLLRVMKSVSTLQVLRGPSNKYTRRIKSQTQ